MIAIRRFLLDCVGRDPGDLHVVIAFDQGGRYRNGSLTLDAYAQDAEGCWDYSREVLSLSGEDASVFLAELVQWTPGDVVSRDVESILERCLRL
jgi:hypothetical protein